MPVKKDLKNSEDEKKVNDDVWFLFFFSRLKAFTKLSMNSVHLSALVSNGGYSIVTDIGHHFF